MKLSKMESNPFRKSIRKLTKTILTIGVQKYNKSEIDQLLLLQ